MKTKPSIATLKARMKNYEAAGKPKMAAHVRKALEAALASQPEILNTPNKTYWSDHGQRRRQRRLLRCQRSALT
jgi:hypothetical protein